MTKNCGSKIKGIGSHPLRESQILSFLQVDSVCKIFKLRHEADIASDAKSRQTGASRMEESVQFLREHGLAGLARHAMALVMTHDGATASSPAESRVLTDSTCQRDSWSHYAMSPGDCLPSALLCNKECSLFLLSCLASAMHKESRICSRDSRI